MEKLVLSTSKLLECLKELEAPSDIFNKIKNYNEITLICKNYTDDMDFIYLRLPDGRKYGIDYEEDSWNWYNILEYNWSSEPVVTYNAKYKHYKEARNKYWILYALWDVLHGKIDNVPKAILKKKITEALKNELIGQQVKLLDTEQIVTITSVIDKNIDIFTIDNEVYIEAIDVICEDTKAVVWTEGGGEDLLKTFEISICSTKVQMKLIGPLEGFSI